MCLCCLNGILISDCYFKISTEPDIPKAKVKIRFLPNHTNQRAKERHTGQDGGRFSRILGQIEDEAEK